jgi:hypothetical protein
LYRIVRPGQESRLTSQSRRACRSPPAPASCIVSCFKPRRSAPALVCVSAAQPGHAVTPPAVRPMVRPARLRRTAACQRSGAGLATSYESRHCPDARALAAGNAARVNARTSRTHARPGAGGGGGARLAYARPGRRRLARVAPAARTPRRVAWAIEPIARNAPGASDARPGRRRAPLGAGGPAGGARRHGPGGRRGRTRRKGACLLATRWATHALGSALLCCRCALLRAC